ncbi:MAG: monooxygenase [Betaproteobacteria bacterium]|nr:monooxygenase [Betaproteobacteria bacterium]
MQQPSRILIAGAGLGGLCAAAALLQRGFDVDVYEQAAELKEVGAGVQLSANGTRVLAALGMAEALRALSCEAQGKEIRHWKTGETWKLFDLGPLSIERFGFPYFTVYRPDLLEVLASAVRALKPDAIHLGQKIADFEQDGHSVELLLESGERVTGAVLVGADGVHSRVRQGLFGADRAQFSGVVAWRAVVPMERLPAHMARMVGSNWVGPGGHIVHYPLRSGRLMNFVGALERTDWQVESWSHRGSCDELAQDFDGWHKDIQSFIAQIEAPNKWALMLRPPLARWSVGRVTLLGDAAHSMLPFLAQGAVMAIEDGFMLARCLSDFVPDEALQRFERARLTRTTRVVEGAAANKWRFHNPVLAELDAGRQFIEREWAGARISDRYDWLFRYDATTEEL